MRQTAIAFALLLLVACGRDAAPPATVDTPPPAATPAPEPAPVPTVPSPVTRAPTFIGAWRADTGSGVETGTRYVFEADGTLRVESPTGTPMVGAWKYVDGALTMTEEGVDYATDILLQDATHLNLRSHNPGGYVDLMLVREQ